MALFRRPRRQRKRPEPARPAALQRDTTKTWGLPGPWPDVDPAEHDDPLVTAAVMLSYLTTDVAFASGAHLAGGNEVIDINDLGVRLRRIGRHIDDALAARDHPDSAAIADSADI